MKIDSTGNNPVVKNTFIHIYLLSKVKDNIKYLAKCPLTYKY